MMRTERWVKCKFGHVERWHLENGMTTDYILLELSECTVFEKCTFIRFFADSLSMSRRLIHQRPSTTSNEFLALFSFRCPLGLAPRLKHIQS